VRRGARDTTSAAHVRLQAAESAARVPPVCRCRRRASPPQVGRHFEPCRRARACAAREAQRCEHVGTSASSASCRLLRRRRRHVPRAARRRRARPRRRPRRHVPPSAPGCLRTHLRGRAHMGGRRRQSTARPRDGGAVDGPIAMISAPRRRRQRARRAAEPSSSSRSAAEAAPIPAQQRVALRGGGGVGRRRARVSSRVIA
jgi:hypothetical protein